MIKRSNFWWLMATEGVTKPAEDFIESLTAEQMHKLDDVFWAAPDHQLVWEMLGGKEAIGKLVEEGWSREDIQQIEGETFGIFAGALLRAFRGRTDGAEAD